MASTGGTSLKEETLDLEGYKGSRPVRIGNARIRQLQLDIYGELMDSLYLFNKYGAPISYDLWMYLRRLTNWVCDHWRRKDRRHLGSTRRPRALRVLQGDVLGGGGSRAAAGEEAIVPGGLGALDARRATKSTNP